MRLFEAQHKLASVVRPSERFPAPSWSVDVKQEVVTRTMMEPSVSPRSALPAAVWACGGHRQDQMAFLVDPLSYHAVADCMLRDNAFAALERFTSDYGSHLRPLITNATSAATDSSDAVVSEEIAEESLETTAPVYLRPHWLKTDVLYQSPLSSTTTSSISESGDNDEGVGEADESVAFMERTADRKRRWKRRHSSPMFHYNHSMPAPRHQTLSEPFSRPMENNEKPSTLKRWIEFFTL